jgi:hypothetical protein
MEGIMVKIRSEADRAERSRRRLENPRETWAAETATNARRRAKLRNCEVDITKEWLLENIPERCPLLGLEFVFLQRTITDNTPTVDRKDPKKGYTMDNCWIISAKANRMKSNASTRDMELLVYNLPKMYAAPKK